jgi:hypothetical protein
MLQHQSENLIITLHSLTHSLFQHGSSLLLPLHIFCMSCIDIPYAVAPPNYSSKILLFATYGANFPSVFLLTPPFSLLPPAVQYHSWLTFSTCLSSIAPVRERLSCYFRTLPSVFRYRGQTALEDSNSEVDINSAWETIRDRIKLSAKESLGYYELK